jgi:hypothetical protein
MVTGKGFPTPTESTGNRRAIIARATLPLPRAQSAARPLPLSGGQHLFPCANRALPPPPGSVPAVASFSSAISTMGHFLARSR